MHRQNVIFDIENKMKRTYTNIVDIDKYWENFNCEVVFKENTIEYDSALFFGEDIGKILNKKSVKYL